MGIFNRNSNFNRKSKDLLLIHNEIRRAFRAGDSELQTRLTILFNQRLNELKAAEPEKARQIDEMHEKWIREEMKKEMVRQRLPTLKAVEAKLKEFLRQMSAIK